MLNLVIGFSGLGSLFRYFWMKKKRRTRSWVGFVLYWSVWVGYLLEMGLDYLLG